MGDNPGCCIYHVSMLCITESFVYKLLSRLDIPKSTRLDGIGPRLPNDFLFVQQHVRYEFL